MIASVEGHIMETSSSPFQSSIDNALYGILINNSKRLIYDPHLGLDLMDMK